MLSKRVSPNESLRSLAGSAPEQSCDARFEFKIMFPVVTQPENLALLYGVAANQLKPIVVI